MINICPGAPMVSAAAEQHFERGVMIWVEEQDGIYVLFSDDLVDPGWTYYPDAWQESMPDHDPSLIPPEGLHQPVRGFGLVWREMPYVRERLGWALDQETAFTTIVQSEHPSAQYTGFYIQALDGDIWHLKRGGGSNYWSELRH